MCKEQEKKWLKLLEKKNLLIQVQATSWKQMIASNQMRISSSSINPFYDDKVQRLPLAPISLSCSFQHMRQVKFFF